MFDNSILCSKSKCVVLFSPKPSEKHDVRPNTCSVLNSVTNQISVEGTKPAPNKITAERR